MAIHLIFHRQAAAMTSLIEMMRTRTATTNEKPASGFSMTELLIAAMLAVIISLITGAVLINNLKSNAKAEARQRMQGDWNRTTALLESEISISRSATSSNLNLTNDEFYNYF